METQKVGLETEGVKETETTDSKEVKDEDLFVLEDGFKIKVSNNYEAILGAASTESSNDTNNSTSSEGGYTRQITQIKLQESPNSEEDVDVYKGETVEYKIRVRAMKMDPTEDVKVRINLPEGVTFDNATSYNDKGEELKGEYKKSSHSVEFDFESIDQYADITLVFKVNQNINDDKIGITTNVSSENLDKMYAKTKEYTVIKGRLDISYGNNLDNNYVKDGDEITYKLKIKNISGGILHGIDIRSEFPEELELSGITLKKESEEDEEVISGIGNVLNTIQYLEDNESLEMTIKVIAQETSEKEKKVINYVTVSTTDQTYRSDTIEMIIQATSETSGNSTQNAYSQESSYNSDNSYIGTGEYKITGKIWNDVNSDGTRDSDEKGIENIVAVLYNAETDTVITKVATDSIGNYVFAKLPSGKYYIVYEYNTEKYSLTDYKKQGVSADKNSDAILANEQSKTDVITIKDRSISNIDVGLIDGNVFDFYLTKTISKITVQNDTEIKTIEGNDETLAKVEIKAKDLATSTVYIEYKITVVNNGQVAGTVEKVVDYLPKEMNLDTEINKNWYIGSDGNAYNEELAGTVIEPKQSKELTLIVSKEVTEENTGISTNKAEIAAISNDKQFQDIDSSPGNGATDEDDLGQADVIISISTGGGVVSTMVIITLILNLLLIGYFIIRKIDKEREVVL